MRDRTIRLGLGCLVLLLPLLIEVASPSSAVSWLESASRVAMVDLVVLAGVAVAAWHRRGMRAGWHDDRPLAPTAPRVAMASVTQKRPARRPEPCPVRVPQAATITPSATAF